MLLNKLPCLDKGYVALISSSNDSRRIVELRDEFFGAIDMPELYELGTLTLAIKCPLFVQLHLSRFNLKIMSAKPGEPEAYTPDVGDVRADDTHTSKIIADDMARTTEALLINPKAYQADGCDKFVSQVISPISVYTTLIVHGSYNEWQRYCKQERLPAPIEAYRALVQQILINEWK